MEKIIIAGGRDFDDYELLKSYCNSVINGNNLSPVTIISGHAKGADSLGERYAQEMGYPLEIYPADWDKNGKRAGFIRNSQMAQVGTRLIAFWDGGSTGTADMITKAQEAGMKIHIQLYNY